MRGPSAFWFELRRRNVVRAALLYVGAVWALAQGMAQLAPVFGLPDSLTRWFVLACTLGFPFWLLLAWLYELTPTGLKRESEAPSEPGMARPRANRRLLDYAIIAVLSVVVVLLATNTLFGRKAIRTAAGTADLTAVFAGIPEKSVAVLPLENEGASSDQQFFSDGLSEDIITALSQFDGLKVISRNSAFQFRGSHDSPSRIAAKLGVAHVLEGSVRRNGNAIRVRVELIRAIDGSALRSEHYDRRYADLFKLQDEIVASVAHALEARLLTRTGAVQQHDRPPGGSLDAYSAYLRGNGFFAGNSEASLRAALDFYNEAIRLDAGYAAAYAQTSMVWTNLANQFLNGDALNAAIGKARAAANTALALNSGLALAHAANGLLLDSVDFDWLGARTEYQRALELAPQDSKAQFYLASLLATLGEPERAIDLTRRSLVSDPRNVSRYDWLAGFLIGVNRLDEARAAVAKGLELQPGASGLNFQLAVIATLRHDSAAALDAAQREAPGPWQDVAAALARQVGSDRAGADASLQGLITRHASTSAYQIAQVFALRADADNTFKWLDQAWANRDSGIVYLLYDPFIARYRHDPRFAAFCRKAGLPLPEPRDERAATAAAGGAA